MRLKILAMSEMAMIKLSIKTASDLCPAVFIVVVNYNCASETIACMQSLKKISYPNFKIVIIDNASSDGSFEEVQKHLNSQAIEGAVLDNSHNDVMVDLGKTILMQARENGGYGAGNNIGIRYALKSGADYVLVLNNDTVVSPDFLEPLVCACEEDRSIGIASSKIYFYDRPDVLWFNGGKFHSLTAKVEHVGFGKKDAGQVSFSNNTFISGCCLFVPRKTFEEVGLINEEYFMYVEDLEFSQRVLSAGRTLKIIEQSHVWHKVGASTGGRFSSFSTYWRARNMTMFLLRQGGMGMINFFAVLMFNSRFFLSLVCNRKLSLITMQVKGIRDAFTGQRLDCAA